MFDLFLEADKPFAKYNYPCTLAICAEGIDIYPEWVNYIIKNKHRYKIELHCNKHQNYKFLPRKKIIKELDFALNKLWITFGVEPTIWYPPKGRKGEPEDKDGICEELGIECFKQIGKVDAKFWLKNPDKYPHVNFHFWHQGQCEHVKQIIEICQK